MFSFSPKGMLTGILVCFLACACVAQDSGIVSFGGDMYDSWAPRLFQKGELKPYQSVIPERQPSADSLPPLPWAYEIDAGQFRHHLARLDGWVWLMASNNGCGIMPRNLPLWTPFFDSLKRAASIHIRYAMTDYNRKRLLDYRQALDERGASDPLLIVSNEAHGSNNKAKLRRFVRQLAQGHAVPKASAYHLLYDPNGRCVFVAADRYDYPFLKPPKRTKALFPAEIQRQALLLMRAETSGL